MWAVVNIMSCYKTPEKDKATGIFISGVMLMGNTFSVLNTKMDVAFALGPPHHWVAL